MARLAGCCHRFIPTPVGNTRCAALHDGRPTVHPHACGEHRIGTAADRAVSGSSPRLWGTHHIADVRHGKHRFIPTPVGNTLPLLRQLIAQAVHPHACGEHPHNRWCRPDCTRFIPTPVGNTADVSARPNTMTVHPHACGEHGRKARGALAGCGSSPRLWGTRPQRVLRHRRIRFIPTPVGNTYRHCGLPRSRRVHPHACGEHAFRSGLFFALLRFIPTPVGNTVAFAFAIGLNAVHPHACGEHPLCSSPDRANVGSSPRLWGTRKCAHHRVPNSRFIPTPVGNTAAPAKRRCVRAVHPHACGEHLLQLNTVFMQAGSSPRLWGTRSWSKKPPV